MFRTLKLYFTNRPYYEQRKRYRKLQKATRKKLKELAREFCPWSGWFMHETIRVMIEFYEAVYTSGDCCWATDEYRAPIIASLRSAREYADKIAALDTATNEELLEMVKNDKSFEKYLAAWELENNTQADNDVYRATLAEDYLYKKYTKAMYKIIGENIWEWND